MAPMNSIPHDTGAVSTYNLVSPMLHALDEAERALWPAGRVLCPDHGTFAEMALLTAAMEDEGRYVVPVACGVCGGWTIEAEAPKAPTYATLDMIEDTRYVIAAYILRTYPDASYARWDDLRGGYAPIGTRWCVLTHTDGYGVHAVLPSGTLGALIERVRI